MTGSALNASSEIENCTPSFDPHISPANSATMAEAAQTTAQMFFNGIPTESAAWWSSATARRPRPTRVLLKNQASAATSTAAVPAAATSKVLMNRPRALAEPLDGNVGDADVEGVHVGVPYPLRHPLDDEVQADRGHEQDDGLLVDERAEHDPLDGDGHHDHHQQGHREGAPQHRLVEEEAGHREAEQDAGRPVRGAGPPR